MTNVVQLEDYRLTEAEKRELDEIDAPRMPHQFLAKRIWDSKFPMTERQAKFVEDMMYWPIDLTRKQANWLKALAGLTEAWEARQNTADAAR